jgi:hypothetical protein
MRTIDKSLIHMSRRPNSRVEYENDFNTPAFKRHNDREDAHSDDGLVRSKHHVDSGSTQLKPQRKIKSKLKENSAIQEPAIIESGF